MKAEDEASLDRRRKSLQRLLGDYVDALMREDMPTLRARAVEIRSEADYLCRATYRAEGREPPVETDRH